MPRCARQDEAHRQTLLAEMFERRAARPGRHHQPADRPGHRAAGGRRADPEVGEAIRQREDASARARRAVSPARRRLTRRGARGWSANRGSRGGAGQEDHRGAGDRGRRGDRVAGGLAELRPAGAAGRQRAGGAGPASPGRGVRRRSCWATPRLGVPAARRQADGGADRGRHEAHGRTGAHACAPASSCTGNLLPPFDIAGRAGALRCRRSAAWPRTLDGVTARWWSPPPARCSSLPFEVLLTGPADAGASGRRALAGPPFTMAHVPAPANFVALRKIAGGSRADQPVVRLRRLPAGDAGAGRRHSFPGAACADSAQLLAGLPPLPVRAARNWRPPGAAGRRRRDELLGPAFTVPAVLKAQPEGLPHPAFRHPRAAAGRTALPERAGDRHLRPAPAPPTPSARC